MVYSRQGGNNMIYILKCEKCNKEAEVMCKVDDRNSHVCGCGGKLIVQVQPVVAHWICNCPTSSKGAQTK